MAFDRKHHVELGQCLQRFAQVADIANAMEPPRWVRYGLAAVAAVFLAALAGVGTYQQVAPPKELIRLTVEAEGPGAGGLLAGIGGKLGSIKSNEKTRFEVIQPALRATTSLKATHSMVAELKQEAGKILVESSITDLSTGRRIAKWSSDYAPDQVNRIPRALAGLLTMTFHLPPLASEKMANPTAAELYLQGVKLTKRDSGLDEAVRIFSQALVISPEEPLIHAGLAEARWFKYYRTRDQLWLDGATESVRNAERLNPDLAPVHLAAGLLDNRAGRYDLALKQVEK
jgi:tetratricopeptide (TPR) repeat protein